MMTDSVKGKTLAEAREHVRAIPPDGDRDTPTRRADELGKLAVFAGVRQFPARVKCASLAWHTLRSAVDAKDDAKDEVVSTEGEEPR